MVESNPINPIDKVRIESVKDKPEEQKQKLEALRVEKKLFLYLAFLNVLKNTFKAFNYNPEAKEGNLSPLKKELQTIKASFEALKVKDLSQDTNFLNYLAFTWLKFFKDFDFYPIKEKEITTLIKNFINEINSFPKENEFSLGYYLSEFAGYKWIPFPYMEILQNLHFEYQKNKENSQLEKWVNILQEAIDKA